MALPGVKAKPVLLEQVDQVVPRCVHAVQALINGRAHRTDAAGRPERARQITPFIRELRSAVACAAWCKASSAKAARPRRQPAQLQTIPREGRRVYFKFVDAGGRLLRQSTGFDAPKEAGQAIAQLQRSP